MNYDYNFLMLNETLLFDLPPKESPVTCGVDRFAIAAVVLGIVVVAVGIFASCAGYSMAIAWNMLTFLQFVNYMPMMRVFMHSCLVDFSQSFGVFNGALNFGNFLTAMLFPSGFPWKAIDYKYIRAGFWFPQFMYNCSDIIGLAFLCIIAMPILNLVVYFFPKVVFFR